MTSAVAAPGPSAGRRAPRGVVVVGDATGRSLRARRATIRCSDVLYSSGAFAAGDDVYVAFRTNDGSQYVVAVGNVRIGYAELHAMLRPPDATAQAGPLVPADSALIHEMDVALLWHRARKVSAASAPS